MVQYPKFTGKNIAILGYGKEGKSSLQFLLYRGVSPKNITILDAQQQVYEDNKQDFLQYPGITVI